MPRVINYDKQGNEIPIPTDSPLSPGYAGPTTIGMKKGEEYSKRLMGLSTDQFAPMFQDLLSQRKEAASGLDPASTQIRQQGANQLRAAKMGGTKLSSEQEMQARRETDTVAGQTAYKTQQDALGRYQNLVGGLAAQNQANTMGFASLEAGLQMPTPPTGGGISVICTKMYTMGILSQELYLSEQAYGDWLVSFDPAVYVGYRVWADPVVSLMNKWMWFNNLVSFFAMKWVNYMHSGEGFLGKLINAIGTPICRFIGNISLAIHKTRGLHA